MDAGFMDDDFRCASTVADRFYPFCTRIRDLLAQEIFAVHNVNCCLLLSTIICNALLLYCLWYTAFPTRGCNRQSINGGTATTFVGRLTSAKALDQ